MVRGHEDPAHFLERNGFAKAGVLPAQEVAGTFEAFLDIVAKQKEGRAGGEDGAVAEFIKRLPAELVETLRGAQAQPTHWLRASVSLIPHILQAALPGDVRPIIVLSVSVKLAAKLWLEAAKPYLELRSSSPHGIRPMFRAAEVHRLMRELVSEHQEWGVHLTIIKLDIAKAYDTLLWASIEDEFVQRGMPFSARCAIADEKFSFHTGDAAISFALTPNQGIPQGSPESPAVYAAVLEGLLNIVEARLAEAKSPAGLPLCFEDSAAQVEQYKKSSEAFRVDDLFVVNFADDTYVISREVQEAEYTTAVIRQEYAKANQKLHASKFQAPSNAEGGKFFMWTDEDLQTHMMGGKVTKRSVADTANNQHGSMADEEIPVVRQTVVLGSVIATHIPAEAAVSSLGNIHRLQRAVTSKTSYAFETHHAT